MNDRYDRYDRFDRDPDLEGAIARTFEHRSERLGMPGGRLDDVMHRVRRRQARRRNVAMIGSFAAVGAGVLGIAALRGGEPSDPVADGPAAAPTQPAWTCSGQLDYFGEDGTELYFSTCAPADVDASIPVLDAPSPTIPSDTVMPIEGTTPATFFVTTTTIVPTGTSPAMTTDVDCTGGSTPDTTVPTVPTTTLPGGGAALAPGEQAYTVVPGDSLAGIGERYGVDPNILANYNSWSDCLDHLILPGDVVMIPPNATVPETLPTTTTAP
jgi:LysM repeat protein